MLLLAVLLAGSMAGTAWIWPRLAGPGPLRWVGRVAAIVACQLAAVLALAVAVNDYFDFYGSWSDLFGTAATGPVTILQYHPASPGAGSPASSGSRGSSTPLDVDRQYAAPLTRPGRVESVQVSGATGLSEEAFVYLPPQYDAPGASGRLPVTMIVAGYPGHVGTLVRNLDTVGTMGQLIRSGRTLPMVLVLISPTVASPRDTECADVVRGPPVETYLSADVPAWVAAHYRVFPPGRHWGVLGVSTGGFCAVKLAMRHPEVFGSAVGMSGYLHTLQDVTTGDLYGGDRSVRNANDPLWRLAHLPPPPVAVLLTAGRTESSVYPDVQRFVGLTRPPTSVATIVVPASGHNFEVWKRLLPTCLQWLSSRFAG
jgi:enterochelin esterase-like enzyme